MAIKSSHKLWKQIVLFNFWGKNSEFYDYNFERWITWKNLEITLGAILIQQFWLDIICYSENKRTSVGKSPIVFVLISCTVEKVWNWLYISIYEIKTEVCGVIWKLVI